MTEIRNQMQTRMDAESLVYSESEARLSEIQVQKHKARE